MLVCSKFMADIAAHRGAADEGASQIIETFRIIGIGAADPAPTVEMLDVVGIQ